MLAEASSELRRDDAEVRDLHGIVFSDAAQFVPPGELGLFLGRCTSGDEQLDGGIGEMLVDLGVSPIPPVAPLKGLADGAVALAVELRQRPLGAGDRDIGEVAEGPRELGAVPQFQIGTLYL